MAVESGCSGVLSRILAVVDSRGRGRGRGSSIIPNGGIIPVVPIVVFPEKPSTVNN